MLRYHEHLSIKPKQLWWLIAVAIAAVVGGSVILLVPIVIACVYSLLRFSGSDIKIDDFFLYVGRKKMPLVWLDPSSLGQPRNVWPWFWFSSRRMTCVPFWTKSAIGIKGKNNQGERVFVSLGTNDRDQLIGAILAGITRARLMPAAGQSRSYNPSPVGPQGWFPDPWDPVRSLRWFDGYSWTGWTSPLPGRMSPGYNA
jgi:hypothetical protein